jgi:hypothetical protein
VSGVLAVDHVGTGQQFEGPTRDIAEIPDRGRDDDQFAEDNFVVPKDFHDYLPFGSTGLLPSNIVTYVEADE